MMTRNTPDPASRDNRKHWLKFLLLTLLCTAGGAVLGYGAAWAADSFSFDALGQAAGRIAGACAPFALLLTVPFLLAAVACWRRAQRQFGAWDGEDEDTPERADRTLSWGMVWTSAAQLLGFLLFGITASLLPLGYIGAESMLLPAAGMIALMFAVIAVQRRIVDLTRRINPEKQGSVYDLKFRQKWLASCDEAERQRIGQAAYRSYAVTSYACLFVWLALVLVNVLVPIGPLPIAAVMVPWALGQFTYLGQCIRMETPKRSR